MLLLRDRSPRVEGMINGEVDGLTRVQLRVNAVAQTEAELAAHREMQDVYEAKRMLAEARKTGNEMDVKRAEEKLAGSRNLTSSTRKRMGCSASM